MSLRGHQLPRCHRPSAAARHLITDTNAGGRRGREGPIALQKSLKPERRFSRLKPTQAKVATKSDSGPIIEVTDELSARSCDPPHPYMKNAPTAQKFSDQRCKRTFATVSTTRRLTQCNTNGAKREIASRGGLSEIQSGVLIRRRVSLA